MINQKKISVQSAGNPSGGGGVGPMTLYNNPQFDVENETHGGLNKNAYYFSLKIEPTYTLYKIIFNKDIIRSYGGVRGAYLAIAFSIPKGYKLVGTDPYRVLMDLWDTFKNNYMSLKDKINGVYSYTSDKIDPNILNETAAKFKLIPTERPYRPMAKEGAKAIVTVPEEKIGQLLSDVNYDQFLGYSEIIIAENVLPGSNLKKISNLDIPRKKNYSLYVDDEEKGKYSDTNAPINVRSSKNSNYYVNNEETFTIQELLDKSSVIDGITINEEKEEIRVSTSGWSNPKKRIIQISITPKEGKEYFQNHKDMIVLKNKDGENIDISDTLSFELIGEEFREFERKEFSLSLNKNCSFEIISDNYSNKKENYHTSGDNTLMLDVKLKQNPINLKHNQTATLGNSLQNSVWNPITNAKTQQNQSQATEGQVIPVNIILQDYTNKVQPYTSNSSGFVDYPVYLKDTDKTDDRPIWMERIIFNNIISGNQSVLEANTFYVPSKYLACYLSFKKADIRYTTLLPLHKYLKKGLITLQYGDFKEFVQPAKRSNILIKIGILSGVLILGMIIGFFLRNPLESLWAKSEQKNTEEVTDNPTEVKDEPQKPEESYTLPTPEDFEKAQDFILAMHDTLSKKEGELKFSYIDSIYVEYSRQEKLFDILVYFVPENKDRITRLTIYYKLSQAIQKGDIETINNIVKDTTANKLVWPSHQRLINKLFLNKDYFSSHYKNYEIFNDLNRSSDK